MNFEGTQSKPTHSRPYFKIVCYRCCFRTHSYFMLVLSVCPRLALSFWSLHLPHIPIFQHTLISPQALSSGVLLQGWGCCPWHFWQAPCRACLGSCCNNQVNSCFLEWAPGPPPTWVIKFFVCTSTLGVSICSVFL